MKSLAPPTALALLVLYATAALHPAGESSPPRDPSRPGCFQTDGAAASAFVHLMGTFGGGDAAPLAAAEAAAADAEVGSKRRRRRGSPKSRSPSSHGSTRSDGLSSTATHTTATAAPPPPQQASWVWHPLYIPPPTTADDAVPLSARALPQLFIGQLKRDCAAACVRALLGEMLPHVRVVHIVPSVNATTGQGRGCAWVYFATEADAEAVRGLHHRVFIDLDAQAQRVGFVVCHPGATAELRAFASVRGGVDPVARKRRLMPCQPLVVETTARTIGAAASESHHPPHYSDGPHYHSYEPPHYTSHATVWAAAHPPGSVPTGPRTFRHDPYSIEVFPPPSYASVASC